MRCNLQQWNAQILSVTSWCNLQAHIHVPHIDTKKKKVFPSTQEIPSPVNLHSTCMNYYYSNLHQTYLLQNFI